MHDIDLMLRGMELLQQLVGLVQSQGLGHAKVHAQVQQRGYIQEQQLVLVLQLILAFRRFRNVPRELLVLLEGVPQ